MGAYIDPSELGNVPEESCEYELKSVLIHRGGAHGGHYHAYIQDECREGNWHLKMPEEFLPEPKVIEKKTFDPKEHMSEEEKKQFEERKEVKDQ